MPARYLNATLLTVIPAAASNTKPMPRRQCSLFCWAVRPGAAMTAMPARPPVPEHANNLAWSLGGLTAVALFVLIGTGILMTQFYNPSPARANASVRNLVTEVWGGGFVRGVHFWAAQAMYVLAALHLLRVFLTGSFKRTRG